MSTLPAAAATPQPPSTLSLAFIERIRAGVSIEELRELYRFQREIEADANRAAYADDFAKMQGELPEAPREGRIDIGRGKPQSYAKWEDISAAIKPVLSKYGFALHFRCTQDTGFVTVTAFLTHRLGHSEQTPLRLPYDNSGSKNTVQSVGSSLSYGKRYTAGLLLNWATRDEDDDGQAGGARENPHVTRAGDLTDVPAPDDPDRIPFPREPVQELPKTQQREVADKLNRELIACKTIAEVENWKNLESTTYRAWQLREMWRDTLQGRVKEKLMELRGAAAQAAFEHERTAQLAREYPEDHPAPGDLGSVPL